LLEHQPIPRSSKTLLAIPFSDSITHRIVRCGLVNSDPMDLNIENFQILADRKPIELLPPDVFPPFSRERLLLYQSEHWMFSETFLTKRERLGSLGRGSALGAMAKATYSSSTAGEQSTEPQQYRDNLHDNL
jgi:hypothetical protein